MVSKKSEDVEEELKREKRAKKQNVIFVGVCLVPPN